MTEYFDQKNYPLLRNRNIIYFSVEIQHYLKSRSKKMTAVHIKKTGEPWFRSIYDQVDFVQHTHKSDQKNGKNQGRKSVQHIRGKFAYNSFVDSLSLNVSSYSNSSKSTRMTASQSYPNMEIFHQTETTEFSEQLHQNQINTMENPISGINSTKPAFIQYFDRLNTVLPNYHHQHFNLQQQIQKLGNILQAAHRAYRVVKLHAQKQIIKSRISDDVKNLGLKFVNKSDCETCKENKIFDELKPRSNFKIEVFNQQSLKQKLMLIESKIARYQIALSLTTKIDLNLYLRIREVLLEVQEELIKCSASIYMAELKESQYPNFCYAYVELIKSGTDSSC